METRQGLPRPANGEEEQKEQGKGLERSRAATLQKHSWGGCRQHPRQTQQAPTGPGTATYQQEWVLPTAPSPFSRGWAGTGTHRPSKSKPGFPLALPAIPITHSLFVRSPFSFRAH